MAGENKKELFRGIVRGRKDDPLGRDLQGFSLLRVADDEPRAIP